MAQNKSRPVVTGGLINQKPNPNIKRKRLLMLAYAYIVLRIPGIDNG
jgi:hypothetical protein